MICACPMLFILALASEQVVIFPTLVEKVLAAYQKGMVLSYFILGELIHYLLKVKMHSKENAAHTLL